jgi:hypothetical protein
MKNWAVICYYHSISMMKKVYLLELWFFLRNLNSFVESYLSYFKKQKNTQLWKGPHQDSKELGIVR